jgi:hypothetical protein
MVSSGLLRHVALVRTDVSEEPGASFIRVTKIGELGTAQAATSNRRTLRSQRRREHSWPYRDWNSDPFVVLLASRCINCDFPVLYLWSE